MERRTYIYSYTVWCTGVTIAKIAGRIPAVVKMKKAADAVKGGKARKASQIASRMVEGAGIVGATDFLASEPGRESLFFKPEDTKGLSGREKAGAEFRNRIKYGLEGTSSWWWFSISW